MMPYTVHVPHACLSQHAPQTAPVQASGLPCLSFLQASTSARIAHKAASVLVRMNPESLSRHNITITLDPFATRGRTPTQHPVPLHTGIKRIPKPLSGCRHFWTLASQNIFGIQTVKPFHIVRYKNKPQPRMNANKGASFFCGRGLQPRCRWAGRQHANLTKNCHPPG
jgi:hypothetical protein